jgi:hypothetical protein
MNDISVVYISIGAWATLGVFMYWVFIRMQYMERDTRLPEELGNMALGQYLGTGSINNARPVRKPFARLTFYKDFLVPSFKAQRISMPYSTIESIKKIEVRKRIWVEVVGIAKDRQHSFVFSVPEVDEVIAELEKYTGLTHE